MRFVRQVAMTAALLSGGAVAEGQSITAAGQPAQLDVRAAGDRSIRVTLKPISQDYLTGKGSWIRMTWSDRARQLAIEPGAPRGTTNVSIERAFRIVLMPDGTAKDVTYAGKRVQMAF
jgi:hypothetical protein